MKYKATGYFVSGKSRPEKVVGDVLLTSKTVMFKFKRPDTGNEVTYTAFKWKLDKDEAIKEARPVGAVVKSITGNGWIVYIP